MVCVSIHVEITVQPMDTVAELKLQGVFSAKFSDVNNAFTIKGPGGLGAFGFTSRCLLMFNNKKWIGGRDKVQHQEGQQRLSWTRETLPSLLQKH